MVLGCKGIARSVRFTPAAAAVYHYIPFYNPPPPHESTARLHCAHHTAASPKASHSLVRHSPDKLSYNESVTAAGAAEATGAAIHSTYLVRHCLPVPVFLHARAPDAPPRPHTARPRPGCYSGCM